MNNSLLLSATKSYYWNVFLPIRNNFSEQNCIDKPVFNIVSRFDHSFSDDQYCYKHYRTLLSIVHFRPTNSLKTKMALLSFLINHYHQTRYICL